MDKQAGKHESWGEERTRKTSVRDDIHNVQRSGTSGNRANTKPWALKQIYYQIFIEQNNIRHNIRKWVVALLVVALSTVTQGFRRVCGYKEICCLPLQEVLTQKMHWEITNANVIFLTETCKLSTSFKKNYADNE